MNREKTAWALAALLTMGLLAWALWPAPQTVETARLVHGDFVRELVEDAQTRVRQRYVVTSPMTGHLVRPRLSVGQPVLAGQTLAEIRPAAATMLDARSQGEQRERVAAMQASLARAQAQLSRSQAAEQQARGDVSRMASLAAQGFVSPVQLEAAQWALAQRQQEQAMAEHDLRSTGHDLQRLQIGLWPPGTGQAGPVWRVQAPAAGRVLKLHRDSEGPIAWGAPILELGDPGELEVVTELLTEDAARLPAQAQAMVGQWGGEGARRVRLTRIEPGAFTKVSALGVEEQRVRAVFDWVDRPAGVLGDGYRMEIRIVMQQAQGVPLAPVSSVFPHGTGHAVFTIEGGRARLRRVDLLGRNGQQAWLRTDLPAGTLLVSYPPAPLREGARVRPMAP